MKGFLWGILAYLFLKFGDKLLDRLFDYFIDKYTMPWIIRVHQAYKKKLFQIHLFIALIGCTLMLKSGKTSWQQDKGLIVLYLALIAVFILQHIDNKKKPNQLTQAT